MFGFFKKKTKQAPARREDPLAIFDEVIASTERQAAEVRRSAATLLALRSGLSRDEQKYRDRLATVKERLSNAELEPAVEKTLRRDELDAQRLLDRTAEALAQADADSKLLLETAEALRGQLQALQEERQSARARLSAGLSVSDALRQQAASFEKLMRLDAARDEVERAHALAELYREEADARR